MIDYIKGTHQFPLVHLEPARDAGQRVSEDQGRPLDPETLKQNKIRTKCVNKCGNFWMWMKALLEIVDLKQYEYYQRKDISANCKLLLVFLRIWLIFRLLFSL